MRIKRIALIVTGLLMLLASACSGQGEPTMDVKTLGSVTVINGIQDADMWIIPQTEQNLKTTLWGTATAAKVKPGETRQAALCEPGDDGLYLLRMIDTDGYYYSANGLSLEANWTIQIREDDMHAVTADVLNADGDIVATYELFSAKL